MPPNYQRSLFQVTELRNASYDSALPRYNLYKVTKNSTTVLFKSVTTVVYETDLCVNVKHCSVHSLTALSFCIVMACGCRHYFSTISFIPTAEKSGDGFGRERGGLHMTSAITWNRHFSILMIAKLHYCKV
jgi:hypothetical protein